MKHNQRRDLLVLLNQEHRSRQAIDHELEWLHALLYRFEDLDHFARAHELFDLIRYRIIKHPGRVKKAATRRDFKAFQFISNKN